MDIRQAFALALRKARKARGLTQEDFSIVSSRTYLSTLERGIKSPTLDKVQELADTLKIHPLTLLALAYSSIEGEQELPDLLDKIKLEILGLDQKN